MKKITSFDRQNLNDVRKYIDDKFKEMEKETGIKFSIGNIRFESQEFTSKFTAFIPGGDTSSFASNKEQLEWNQNCFFFGFEKNDFGKQFTLQGDAYQISGIKPRSRKSPILCKRLKDGKMYKVPTGMVKLALAK